MFTGIVEETGKVQTITGSKTVIECHEDLENTKATINTLYITDIVSGSVIVDFKYIDSEGGNNQ